jgi:MinD superfamily P-loop ATPase
MYIIESLDNSPAADEAAARLLKNQEDIGNAIKPYYGDAAGIQLTALLKEHILIAVDIINDVKAGNATAQAADEAKWTQNADEIAAFLAGANPNWPEEDVKDLMICTCQHKAELVVRYSVITETFRHGCRICSYPEDVDAIRVIIKQHGRNCRLKAYSQK